MHDDEAALEGRPQERDEAERAQLTAPWEVDEEPDGEDGVRHRVDAFTPARKKAFLKALSKGDCILDACREIGVSSRTVYNHQQSDPEFSKNCTLAIDMSATPVELAAWERGVTGVEVDVIRGGKFIGTTLKRSDSILRLLLQGANPKKYGPRPGFTRKRPMAHERNRRGRMVPHERSFDEAVQSVLSKIDAIERHEEPKKLAAGWVKTEDGHWIPPGWVRADGVDAAVGRSSGQDSRDGGACENGDSM